MVPASGAAAGVGPKWLLKSLLKSWLLMAAG
jgi:hypothetical protein